MATLARLNSRAIDGLQAPEVSVEVHISNGLPAFNIVGLPEASVKESKERVRSALISSGFNLPPKRITVHLGPADLPKSGGRYDLAIALGILIASSQIDGMFPLVCECYGELTLSGEIRHVQGILPAVIEAQKLGAACVIPEQNRYEAGLILGENRQGSPIFSAQHLLDVVRLYQNALQLPENHAGLSLVEPALDKGTQEVDYSVDLAEVNGQLQAKRVLEICASGGHSLLMVGPPGAGKSMLAERLITLLPSLSSQEAIELASIRSIAGQSVSGDDFRQRAFIHPHHTASAVALVGGGRIPKPGAVSLAHRGVLFLDELPEFQRAALEALREPIESGKVMVSRANAQVIYPAKSLIVAAMNPSPSGFFPDDPLGRCRDTPEQIARYQKKISGPILDRIDLHLELPPVDAKSLLVADLDNQNETSAEVRERVKLCRQLQFRRQNSLNSELDSHQLRQFAALDSEGRRLLERAIERFGFSARSYHRLLRTARTLADMSGQADIGTEHLAEAVGYRSLDLKKT
ncbi:YifB family Mg chelatase-like AAA ATPase [Thiomicrorhabdus sp.]|uniref:YifB family Mg chelatase-like AAA ATPase n=1 Tax=Thiomicrorhabdus sp. TaxID=2039724 RepID=UPI0029C734BB|nr:YifB family Mg chelatase-like AAA ATPase [Thiomicrorhabdus sp.]